MLELLDQQKHLMVDDDFAYTRSRVAELTSTLSGIINRSQIESWNKTVVKATDLICL